MYEKNCILLIDICEPGESVGIIKYLKRINNDVPVVIANYGLELWSHANDNDPEYSKLTNSSEFVPGKIITGTFKYFGVVKLPINLKIMDCLKIKNFKVFYITEAVKFVEFVKLNDFTSITLMGAAWHMCLHKRPLGINHLPQLLPKGVKFLTHPAGCVPHNLDGNYVPVEEQIKTDKDWIKFNQDGTLWEYVKYQPITDPMIGCPTRDRT